MRYVLRMLAGALVCASVAGCATDVTSKRQGEDDPAFAEAREKGLIPVERVQPQYPRRAALAGVQGCVAVSFDVLPDGRTDNYEVIDSKPQGVFVKTTLLALRDWRFPEREDPIRTQQTITYNLMDYPHRESPECELDPELPEVYRVK